MVQVSRAMRLSYVVFAPEAMAETAAMVAALMSETCARIWSAFHSPVGGRGLGSSESATVAAASSSAR